jgi:hypothetical protein
MSLMMLNNLRQPEVAVDEAVITAELEDVDSILRRSLMVGDPNIAFSYIRRAAEASVVKGLGAAKVLYQTWIDWPQYQKAGVDDEWENVAPALSGLALEQCKSYRDLIRDVYMNPNVPEWVKPILRGKPIAGQIKLLAAAREGDLTEDDWQKVADAVTPAEIREIVRASRGPATRSETRVVITIGRDGVIKAKQGTNGKYITVGTLRNKREELEGDDYERTVRSVAYNRIKTSAGILEI